MTQANPTPTLMVRRNKAEWQGDWGRARDRLPEYPEDWLHPGQLAVGNTGLITADGNAGPSARSLVALVRSMGAAIDEEVRHRLAAEGLTGIGSVNFEVLRLERELSQIDNAIGPRYGELEREALAALGLDGVAIDDDERLAAASLAYEPDAERGPVAAELFVLLSRRREISRHLVTYRDSYETERRRWAGAYREEMLAVLTDCRDMGTGTEAHAFVVAEPIDPALLRALDHSARYMPRDWIEHINNTGVWSIERTTARAWMDERTLAVGVPDATNTLGQSALRSGVAHQLGHMASFVEPHLRRVSWAFLSGRTTVDGRRLPLLSLYGPSRPAYDVSETYRDGGFVDPYVGACRAAPTPEDRYQVLPVGLQGLLCGWPDLTPDPDHLHFVLGLLSAA